MLKIKILLIKLFLFFIILSGNSFAKNIPPGSGIADVPANVLILLDKSGSMNARMISGSGFYYPQGLAADGNGNIYGAQISTRGIKKNFRLDWKCRSILGSKWYLSWKRSM